MKYPDTWTEKVMTNQLYDMDSGDVESPQGWFCLAGTSIIIEDSFGFVDRERYATRGEAVIRFDELDGSYFEWENGDDPDDD